MTNFYAKKKDQFNALTNKLTHNHHRPPGTQINMNI